MMEYAQYENNVDMMTVLPDKYGPFIVSQFNAFSMEFTVL